MNCTLRINDPLLSYYLGSKEFDSFDEMSQSFRDVLSKGLIPYKGTIAKISETVQGTYLVGNTELNDTNTAIRFVLEGLLDTNNIEEQFNAIVQSTEILHSKYDAAQIRNDERFKDVEFVKSLLGFLEGIQLSSEFKKSKIYQKFKGAKNNIISLLNKVELTPVEPRAETSDNKVLEEQRVLPYYMYSITNIYEYPAKREDPLIYSGDSLSVIRHKLSKKIHKDILDGKEYYIVLEPDSQDNVQSAEVSELGVVGTLYEKVGDEYRRIYIKKGSDDIFKDDLEITLNESEAKTFGVNKSKKFTLVIPDFSNPSYVFRENPVSEEAVAELIRVRESARTAPSDFILINNVHKSYPFSQRINTKRSYITVTEFVKDSAHELRLAETEIDNIIKPGNLYVLFPNNERAPLNRASLSKEWQQRVIDLVNYQTNFAEREKIVEHLNKLLEFKGGDIIFYNRANGIEVRRQSTRTGGTIVRTEHQEIVTPEQLPFLLEYARINVSKEFLENKSSTFPIIKDGRLYYENVDWIDFYKNHHKTTLRQIDFNGKLGYVPAYSLLFYVKDVQERKLDEMSEQLEQPTIGSIEIEANTEVSTLDIINQFETLADKTEGSTRESLILLHALISDEEVKKKLEGSTVKFVTGWKDDFQGMTDDKEVFINYSLLSNPEKLGDVLAHEIIHVLTVNWLKENPNDPITKELERIKGLIPEGFLQEYGYSNDDPRFISELLARLSDSKTANRLKTIKIESTKENKSLFDSIIDSLKKILAKIFGITELPDNVYDELVTKLVQISTSKKEPKVSKNRYGLTKGIPNIPSGYTQSDVDEYLKQKNTDQSYLDSLVNRFNIDLTDYIIKQGKFAEFLSGKLDFMHAFATLRDRYIDILDQKEQTDWEPTKEEDIFYSSLDDSNFQFLLDYWSSNTTFAKIRKPKPAEVAVNPTIEPVDVEKVLDDEESKKQEKIQEITNEDVNEGRDLFERTGTSVSSVDGADKTTRLFVKMLPAVKKENSGRVLFHEEIPEKANPDHFFLTPKGYVELQIDEIGSLKFVPYTYTWNAISKIFADKLSLEEMLSSLDGNEYAAEVVPEIFILRERLEQLMKSGTSFDIEVLSKFEASFKRASVGIFIALESTDEDETRVSIFDESADFLAPARKRVNSEFIALVQTKDYENFYDKEKGTFLIRKFLEDNKLIIPDPKDKKKWILKAATFSDFNLEKLGFVFDPRTIKGDNERLAYTNFKQALGAFLLNFEEIPISIADFIIKDQGKIKGLNNYFKKIYEIEHKIKPLVLTTMVKNAEGENQSTLSVFNHILQTRNNVNKVSTLEELHALVPRTKNPMFEYSLTKSLLFDEQGNRINDRVLLVDILSGLKKEKEDSASQGSLTIDLSESDWLSFNFICLIKAGLIENTRAETATTSYATRLNNWNPGSGNKLITPFSLIEVFNIFNAKDQTITLEGDSRIYKVWSNYLKAELSRIKQDGGNFGLFSDILNSEEKDILLANLNLTVDQIVETNDQLIRDALGRFFTREYKKYSKIFETKMDNGATVLKDIDIRNKLIPLKENQNYTNQYKAFFVINSMTLHVEETLLFQGDLSQLSKYFKRAKGVQSTGTPVSNSKVITDFSNRQLRRTSFGKLFGSPLVVGETYQSATLKDDIKVSAYHDRMVEGYTTSRKLFSEKAGIKVSAKKLKEELDLLEGYKKVNVGDGTGWINADFYITLLQRVGNLSQDQLTAYNALVLDARKNAHLYFRKEDIKGINTTLTEKEEKIRKKGLKLIAKGKAVFPILKITQRGNTVNSPKSTALEVMDKFAVIPLFPQFVYNKPVAYHLMLKMIKDGIAYTKFESGTKIHTPTPDDFIAEIEKGNIQVELNSKHELLTENLREQIKTPEKAKSENTFGSQFRKLIISHMWVNGKPIALTGESTPGETVRQWEELNQRLSEITERQVLDRFGISKTEGGYDFSAMKKDKVADILLQESIRQDLPKNLIVFFDKFKKGALSTEDRENYYKHFEASFGSQKIQNLIAAIIKKISVQKVKGAQLIQTSISAFDRQITIKGKTRELGFYHFKNGEVQAAECKVTLQGDFKNLLRLGEVNTLMESEGLEDNELNRTRILNRLLEQDSFVEKYKDSITIIGYRIPTQGFNSMDVLVIREFLPRFHASTIVLPAEITVKSGTDYDYDKLSVLFPSLNVDGSLKTEGKEGIQNEMIKASSKILLDSVNYSKLITPNDNSIIFDYLKGTKDKEGLLSILGLSYENPKGTSVITVETNLNQFKATKAKNLLGIAAVWNPFTTLIQKYKIELNSRYVKPLDFGKGAIEIEIEPVLRKDRKFNSYDYLTEDGIPKLEIISQLINVTVDAPSDNSFGLTNLDETDFGAFIYGISMLGYSYETSMNFYHQAVIYKFKRLREDYIRQGYSFSKATTLASADMLKISYKTKTDKNTGKVKPVFDGLDEKIYEYAIKHQEGFTLGRPISVEDTFSYEINDNDRSILSHYLLLSDQASEIRSFQSSINHDTSPDNSIHKVLNREINASKVIQSNIVNPENIDLIRTDSVISGLYISPLLKSLISRMFPIINNPVNLSTFAEKSLTYKDKEKAFRKLNNDFMLSIVQTFGTFNKKNLYEGTEQFIAGQFKGNFVKVAKELQQEFRKEGKEFKLFDILILSVSSKRNLFNPQIFLGLENSTEEKNQITQEWRELLNDPRSKQFAENLAIVGLVQSGWSKSSLYFSDIIPEEFSTPIIEKAISRYEELSDLEKEAYLERFIQTFSFEEGRSLGKKTYLDINGNRSLTRQESYRLMNFVIDYKVAKPVEEEPFVEEVEEPILQTASPQNLWSGSNDSFAAALTNPTTIAKRKGKIVKNYPIVFRGKTYEDAESAYKTNKVNDKDLAKQGKIDPRNNQLMIEVLISKLQQYPELIEELTKRGGVRWLEQSEHIVNGNRFEGKGRNSPFIQNLIVAYEQIINNMQQENVQPSIPKKDDPNKKCTNSNI